MKKMNWFQGLYLGMKRYHIHLNTLIMNEGLFNRKPLKIQKSQKSKKIRKLNL